MNVTTNLAEMLIESTGFFYWISFKNTEARITHASVINPLIYDSLPALPGQWCDQMRLSSTTGVASPIRPAAYRRDCGTRHVLR
jgi:hypothetical protein